MGSQQARDENPNWKGGRSIASNGYMLVRVGVGHRLADVRGYAYEHRLVAEEKFKRALQPGEHVHHVDGNKLNNAPENLEIVSVAEHRYEHRTERGKDRLRKPGEANPTISCECGCGQTFKRYDLSGRPRAHVSGHNQHEATQRNLVLSALREGLRSPSAIALKTGQAPSSVTTFLSELRRLGKATRVSYGNWVPSGQLAEKATASSVGDRLMLEIGPAVAMAVNDVGVPVNAASAHDIASALNELARLYVEQFGAEDNNGRK